MVRCLPGCDTSGVSILAVSGSQGARPAADPVRPGRAARRYIARPEGRRGRESGRTHFLHILGFSAVFASNKEGTSFPRSPPPSNYRNRLSKPYASSLRPDSSIASSAASASAASAPLAKMYSLILGSVPEGRTIPLLPPSRSNSITLAFGRPFTQVL